MNPTDTNSISKSKTELHREVTKNEIELGNTKYDELSAKSVEDKYLLEENPLEDNEKEDIKDVKTVYENNEMNVQDLKKEDGVMKGEEAKELENEGKELEKKDTEEFAPKKHHVAGSLLERIKKARQKQIHEIHPEL